MLANGLWMDPPTLKDMTMPCELHFKQVQTSPIVENEAPLSPRHFRNTFTVSYASKPPCTGDSEEQLRPSRDDMDQQKMAVQAHRAELHEAFVAKHEAVSTLSPAAKEVGVKMLVHAAAVRDVSLARRGGYAPEVLAFMRQTWQTFLAQVAAFFTDAAEGSCGAPLTPAERNASAVESISSIGIWFYGPLISLPLRCYTVQVVGPDGNAQLAVVVGLVSFCYSSYVMQTRATTQQGTLYELARLQAELCTPCHFVPQLLLAPQ